MTTPAHRLEALAGDDHLLARFVDRFRRAGLRGLLADLNRTATRVEVPAEAAVDGFTWEPKDRSTRRWWPQGITTSADAYGADPSGGMFEGHSVIVTSWYARGIIGRLWLGSRLTVLDAGGDGDAPYRHVLLVEPRRRFGLLRLKTVRVHAGGIVWYGKHLFVAGGPRGIRVFRLDDLVRVRNPLRARGYRYVLPQTSAYAPGVDEGKSMTYSFMSLDRAGEEDHLVVGEYGRRGGSHRLMRYAIDRDTELLKGDDRGFAFPTELHDQQVERMQGAALAHGTWFLTSSMGEGNPGDLWVGKPGEYRRHRGVLPTGPEDITYLPQRHQLWTLTEWPDRRWVYAIDAERWASAE